MWLRILIFSYHLYPHILPIRLSRRVVRQNVECTHAKTIIDGPWTAASYQGFSEVAQFLRYDCGMRNPPLLVYKMILLEVVVHSMCTNSIPMRGFSMVFPYFLSTEKMALHVLETGT